MKHSQLLNQDFKDDLILYKAERDEINKRQKARILADQKSYQNLTVMEKAARSKAALDAVILAFGGPNLFSKGKK